MWDQSSGYDGGAGGGGGFMTQQNTPGGGAGGGEKKRRAQNLVPLLVDEILSNKEETLTVEGQEVGMVVLLGQVKAVDSQATKTIYTVGDDSGDIEAVHWVEEGQESSSSSVAENMYVRVIGAVRTSQDRKHVMVFRITQVDNSDEIEAHPLEVAHAKLKIRQLRDKENTAIGANSGGGGLSNSMMGGGFSAGGNQSNAGSAASGGGSSSNFGNSKHDAVYKMIVSCEREEGINRDELLQQLKAKCSKQDVEGALDFLSGEGHIYSTIDEDHFKAIDS